MPDNNEAEKTDKPLASPVEGRVICVACGSKNTATAGDIPAQKQDKGEVVETLMVDIIYCRDCEHVDASI